MPRAEEGLHGSLLSSPGSPGLLERQSSDLRVSVSELSESISESISEFVDTAIQINTAILDKEVDEQSADQPTVETRIRRRCPTREGWLLWGTIGCLSLVFIYFMVHAGSAAVAELNRLLQAFADWGLAGAILLILVYAVCMVILVPGTILNVGAGFLYGTFYGYVVTLLGCMLGAVLCFGLGRKVIRSWVQEKVSQSGPVARLCKLMGSRGQRGQRDTFMIVVVSRLPPVMPFALTNYAFSITDVSFPAFFWGSFVGVTPACLLDAYIGKLSKDLGAALGGGDLPEEGTGSGTMSSDNKHEMESAQHLQLVMGIVLTVFATSVLVVYGNRVYTRLLAEQAESEGTDGDAEEGQTTGTTVATSAEQGQGQGQGQLGGSLGVSRPSSPDRTVGGGSGGGAGSVVIPALSPGME